VGACSAPPDPLVVFKGDYFQRDGGVKEGEGKDWREEGRDLPNEYHSASCSTEYTVLSFQRLSLTAFVYIRDAFILHASSSNVKCPTLKTAMVYNGIDARYRPGTLLPLRRGDAALPAFEFWVINLLICIHHEL